MQSNNPTNSKDDYESERELLISEQKVRDKLLSGRCLCCICGDMDPRVLEEHHIAGRKHSTLTVTLCGNCHRKLSRKQRSYPNCWLQPHLSPLKCIAFTLRGLADILRAISDFLLEQDEDDKNGGSR